MEKKLVRCSTKKYCAMSLRMAQNNTIKGKNKMFIIKFEKINKGNEYIKLLNNLDKWIGLEDCKQNTSSEDYNIIVIDPITPIGAYCVIENKYGSFIHDKETNNFILTIENK